MQQPVDKTNPTLKGSQYAATHKASVVAILGKDAAPPVSSRGSMFYNVDRWTLRSFVEKMCKWAKVNGTCIPTATEVKQWVEEANQEQVPRREIVIAGTPDKLDLRTASALTGGAYHESFHTLRSCRRNLRVDEMCALVLPRWAKVPDWSRYYGLIQEWSNLIEDIRIERRGREEFPGTEEKLHDLQDFILNLEAASKALADKLPGNKAPQGRGALSIITATFRDVGLGYNTDRQRDALAKYKAEDAAAVNFVLDGPLSDLCRESLRAAAMDDTACLRIALDVVGILHHESKTPDPANDPNNQEHQPGGKFKVECPKCHAPGCKMVVRPKSDGNGGKVKGKGILTCTVCGYQEDVDLKQGQGGQGGKADPKYTPKFEGFDEEQGAGGQGTKGTKGDKTDKADKAGKSDKGSKGDKTDKADKQDGEGQGGEGEGADGEKDGEKDGGKQGKGSESGGEGEGDKGEGEEGEGEGECEGELGTTGDQEGRDGTQAKPGEGGGKGAGGHNYQEGAVEGTDWQSLIQDALKDAVKGAGLLDNQTALGQQFDDQKDREVRADGGIKRGEAAYNPLDPGLDTVEEVQPSTAGKAHDRQQAEALYASVRAEASYLRSRLRQVIKAMQMIGTTHGVRKGRRLSGRFLVDSKLTLQDGAIPKRAYIQRDEEIDTTMAASVVIDESGSMCGELANATRVMIAITEPLDALNCPVQVSGFRDGRWNYGGGGSQPLPGDQGEYHRTSGIVHDVFKWFDEPFRTVKWRFANTRATGGTPMADGVQFGLDALNRREETHRVLFVVTDGQPNGDHLPIMKRQLRLAKAAGIHVIGVGLGSGAKYVQKVFPDSVWTDTIAEMPKALIAKLNELVDNRVTPRGCRQMKTA